VAAADLQSPIRTLSSNLACRRFISKRVAEKQDRERENFCRDFPLAAATQHTRGLIMPNIQRTAPPVYRPHGSTTRSTSPPMYRPTPPALAQLKPAGLAVTRPPAPPVYHPLAPRRLSNPVVQRSVSGGGGAPAPAPAPVPAPRQVDDPVTAGTPIVFVYGYTNHGHTIAEIRAQLQAEWDNRGTSGARRYVSWGVGAAMGIIFYDNGNRITVVHAQSAANIRRSRQAKKKIWAALRAAGGGSASLSWRKGPPPGGSGAGGGSSSSASATAAH
jgi:hypothetical protein